MKNIIILIAEEIEKHQRISCLLLFFVIFAFCLSMRKACNYSGNSGEDQVAKILSKLPKLSYIVLNDIRHIKLITRTDSRKNLRRRMPVKDFHRPIINHVLNSTNFII